MVILLAQEKPTGSANGATVTLRNNYSQIRLTGHDFLNIGTGGTATTNYPGTPTQPPAQGNETDEDFPGRVYYVSTDQNGNFRVGEYFQINQATGRATLNASAFDLAGLTSLRLGSIGAQLGETINEFSSDATMSGNSNQAVPTEYAVKTYVDASGFPDWSIKTANYTAVSGDKLAVDSTAGVFTVTLPASPVARQKIEFFDISGKCGTNNVTIARNGAKIVGLEENLVIDYPRAAFTLTYINSTYGWSVTNA
jgi:hypothetical protein